jgi:NtrC-family two-component system response regulator AlgB
MAKHFLAFFARALGRPPATLSPATEKVLVGYAWPGNVRELRNAIERATILWPSAIVEPQALPERISGARDRGPVVGGRFTLDELERAHISAIVAQSKTMEEAAAVLGIDDSTLWRKRKKYEDQDRDGSR